MAKASLADLVAERVSKKIPGPRNFFDRLSAEDQAELLEVRRRFHAGELGSAKSLAEILVEAARERGVATCGPVWMRAWLARRD
jgi:hypothetical protein